MMEYAGYMKITRIEEKYLKVSDFDYDLPQELIAQHPIPERINQAFSYNRHAKKIEHRVFSDVLNI